MLSFCRYVKKSVLVTAFSMLPWAGAFAGEKLVSPDSDGYKLVWSEEFDVDGTPNLDVWSFEEGFQRDN